MSYTNVLQALKSFCDKFTSILEKQGLVGLYPWQELLEEILAIQDLLNDPVISEPLDNYKLARQHPIDKHGVGEAVVSLYEDNKSIKEISAYLGVQGIEVQDKEVKEWLANYASSPIVAKPAIVQASVFDTQVQFQTIFERLQEMLEGAQSRDDELYLAAKTTKEQVQLEYMKEIRQAVKDAASLAAAVANMQSIEQFKQAVIAEVNAESPAVAQRIWKRIRSAKSMFNSLSI